MPTQSDYKPNLCDLSDELEALSTQKKPLDLTYRTETNHIESKLGRIVDLFTQNHTDYLKFSDGTVIRLDQVIEWRLIH